MHPVQRLPQPKLPAGDFFTSARLPPIAVAPAAPWSSGHALFDHLPLTASSQPPDWHVSLFSGKPANAQSDWWKISDFDPSLGDIKPVWELSRMAWALPFAQAARNGDAGALSLLNGWTRDWLQRNPPYKGVNWKCGQEASIRVMHLAMAAHILGQLQSPASASREMIFIHLRRIAPTLAYAKAQDNNHGTSEAAALFIGGLMLGESGNSWREDGRAALEERMARIVLPDGSFSQQSTVYHRLLLDTLSTAELVRRVFNQPAFSPRLMERATAAFYWMHAIADQESGDAPNLGANDSAQLMPLTALPNRDFRSSLQLASILLIGKRAISAAGPWDDAVAWLGLELPKEVQSAPCTRIADDGGFAVLRQGKAMVLLRYARFRFRPSQADVMHVDLWVNGRNWFGDAGTYSYNTDAALMAYFNGTVSHNTVQFDGRTQMPQLGRFLFGDWLKTETAGPLQEANGVTSFAASYRDGKGARHQREVTLAADSLRVADTISGFREKAVLRWRLYPGAWSLKREGDKGLSLSLVDNPNVRLTISSTVTILRSEVTEGWTSLRYLEKHPTPVLEVEVTEPGILTTHFAWHA
jgi:hypothetical protein